MSSILRIARDGPLRRAIVQAAIAAALVACPGHAAQAYTLQGVITVEAKMNLGLANYTGVKQRQSPDSSFEVLHYSKTGYALISHIFKSKDKASRSPGERGDSTQEYTTEVHFRVVEEIRTRSRTKRLCRINQQSVEVVDESTSHEIFTAEYTGPGNVANKGVSAVNQVLLLVSKKALPTFTSGSNPFSDAPVSLDIVVGLGGVGPRALQKTGRREWLHTTTYCGKLDTIPGSSEENDGMPLPGVAFTLPDTLNPPFPAELALTQIFSPSQLRDFKSTSNYFIVDKIHVALAIGDLPVATPALSKSNPAERGSDFVLDVSGKGDFNAATWEVKIDESNCDKIAESPSILQANPTLQSVLANDKFSNITTELWAVRDAPPGGPDRKRRTTPVLCDFHVRLALSDRSMIRSIGDWQKVTVTPRNWSTQIPHDGLVNVSRVFVPGPPGNPITTAELLVEHKPDGTIDIDRTTVARRVSSICIEKTTMSFYSEEACQAYLKSRDGLKAIAGFLKFGYIVTESEQNSPPNANATFRFSAGQAKGVVRHEEGPFSSRYFVSAVDDKLFSGAVIINSEMTLVPGSDGEKCVALHEYLHTLYRQRAIEAGYAAGASGPPPQIYDPKKVIEQMHDVSLNRLLLRIADVVYGFTANSAAGNADHSQFAQWKTWVRNTDQFGGQSVETLILHFQNNVTRNLHPLPNANSSGNPFWVPCGGPKYPAPRS